MVTLLLVLALLTLLTLLTLLMLLLGSRVGLNARDEEEDDN